MKTKVLMYWRYTRSYELGATEVGKYKADVMVSDLTKDIIDCEIKVRKSDLKKELIKSKHSKYLNIKKSNQLCPTKFYIAVPEKLVSEALDITHKLPYGVLQVRDGPLTEDRNQNFIKVIKQASSLQKKFSEKLLRKLIMRCSSELLRLKIGLGF